MKKKTEKERRLLINVFLLLCVQKSIVCLCVRLHIIVWCSLPDILLLNGKIISGQNILSQCLQKRKKKKKKEEKWNLKTCLKR